MQTHREDLQVLGRWEDDGHGRDDGEKHQTKTSPSLALARQASTKIIRRRFSRAHIDPRVPW